MLWGPAPKLSMSLPDFMCCSARFLPLTPGPGDLYLQPPPQNGRWVRHARVGQNNVRVRRCVCGWVLQRPVAITAIVIHA